MAGQGRNFPFISKGKKALLLFEKCGKVKFLTKGRETVKNKKTKWILTIALVLLVSVAATTIAVVANLNSYLRTDEGAINIVPESWDDPEADSAPDSGKEESPEIVIGEETGNSGTPSKPGNTPGNTPGSEQGSSSVIVNPQRAGFVVSDENTVWATETEVEIFRSSYENGENVVTVKSNNGDKVVAPGTENSYTFKLKNTGDYTIHYVLDVDAYITPGDNMIPIESRINRHDGKWIVGGKESYVDVPTLDTAGDSAYLSPGRYTYYTLDWLWPFESGNDEYDTFLGNLAVEEDITITIVIKTTAISVEEAPEGEDEGLVPPDTGDDSILSLWIALAVGATVLLIIIVIFRIREEKRSKTEAHGN